MRRALSVSCLLLLAVYVCLMHGQQAPRSTVFEGARLIVGDGTVIEDSDFIMEGTQFSRAGRRGQVQIPPGAVRVDLSGKTVIPTKVDVHGHIGYQHDFDGTMAKEYFTRENLIDHLERMAYYGVGGVVGIADLVDRSDLRGGRTPDSSRPARTPTSRCWMRTRSKTLPIPGRSAESSFAAGKWTAPHCARSGKPDGPEADFDL